MKSKKKHCPNKDSGADIAYQVLSRKIFGLWQMPKYGHVKVNFLRDP